MRNHRFPSQREENAITFRIDCHGWCLRHTVGSILRSVEHRTSAFDFVFWMSRRVIRPRHQRWLTVQNPSVVGIELLVWSDGMRENVRWRTSCKTWLRWMDVEMNRKKNRSSLGRIIQLGKTTSLWIPVAARCRLRSDWETTFQGTFKHWAMKMRSASRAFYWYV